MRSTRLGLLAALVIAAPAAAQSPPPTLVAFDASDPPGRYTATVVTRDPLCEGPQSYLSTTAPHSAPTFLFAPCSPTLRLSFPVPQASVQLYARGSVGLATQLVATGHTVTGATVTVTVADPTTWKPVVLAAPAGAGAFDRVDLRAPGADLGVDDLSISPFEQPDTVVSATPPARTEGTGATFAFGANRPDVTGWRCSLDGAPLTACVSPVTLSGLGQGAHVFRVATVDGYGAVDPSPAQYVWSVLGPPPETQVTAGTTPVVTGDTVALDFGAGATRYECSVDGGPFAACVAPLKVSGLPPGPHTIDVRAVDADGRPDPTPQRWAFDVPGPQSGVGGGSVVTDLDADRIPDTEEVLPLGNVPPVAGVRTLARLLSGTVYVKLPATTARLDQLGALPGFIALKGIAALPVGTIVDARRGRLALDAASDGLAVGDRRHRVGRATLAQAIFRIRQARSRRGLLSARPLPTSLVLDSAPTTGARCRSGAPAKGAVRRLVSSAKGLFRVTGGASRGEARDAVWSTTDRCDGTVTRVTRGRVTIYDTARRRTRVLRAGHRYFARARLFEARKGRG